MAEPVEEGVGFACFDTTALLSFARVGRLDILEAWFPRAFVPNVVIEEEIERHVEKVPGEPHARASVSVGQRCRPVGECENPIMDELRGARTQGELAERERKRAWRRARAEALPGGGPQATRRALASADESRAIVLVEGISDQIALETLAARRGRDLAGEGISIVPIGGAQAVQGFLTRFGPQGANARLAGLCDAGEEEVFRRSLERAGFGSHLTRLDMARLGFHVCVADLEDELIRALGSASVEAVLDSQGDLGSFRTFQKQPAWRGRTIEAQLRRYMGSADRRKLRYARLLVEALDLGDVPRPLDGVLAHV